MSNGLSNLPYVKAEKPNKSKSGNRFDKGGIIGLAVTLALVGAAALLLQDGRNDSDANLPDFGTSQEAIAQCEARIAKLLTSPATAVYDTSATASRTVWTVNGAVDSENGFGALLRSEFQCSVAIEDGTATTTVDYLR